jgi:hypothetical protein
MEDWRVFFVPPATKTSDYALNVCERELEREMNKWKNQNFFLLPAAFFALLLNYTKMQRAHTHTQMQAKKKEKKVKKNPM